MAIHKYIVILFQGGKDEYLTLHTVYSLQSKFDNLIKTKPEETEIDLWVESPGGSAHAAYKLWLELRARANKLRGWVPDFAKSAATLLVLGMDELYMSISAELGPLDVQIEHPDKENITLSALDVAYSLEYLSNFCLEFGIMGGGALIKYTHLARADVLKEILPFTAKLVEPCITKLDPHLTRRAVYQLKVAEHYAKRMLNKRNLPREQQLSINETEQLIHTLVHEYPVHECVIDRYEAEQLGLPVYNAEEKPEWTEIKKTYEDFTKTVILKKEGISLLDVIPVPTNITTKRKKNKKRNIKKKGGR